MKLKTRRQKRLEQIREHFTDSWELGVEATQLFADGLWFALPYITVVGLAISAIGFFLLGVTNAA